MDTEFINSGSSKSSVSHRLLFNPFDKINLKRSDSMLLHQILLVTLYGEIQKIHTKIINLKYQSDME